jgi:Domain of unknown function (DUF6285)
MNDRPTAVELVVAVRQFLETELMPTLSDARLRFQTLVAANVISIVERELPAEEAALRDEWVALCAFLNEPPAEHGRLADLRSAIAAANDNLCRRLRAGDYDAPEKFTQLRTFVRAGVIRKLHVANPRYLAAQG